MEEQKNNPLKKGILKTDLDFTSAVMNKIDAEETALSNLLANHGTLAPSSDFTTQLMQQLEGKSPAVPYTPVISKKAWIGIAAAFIGFICLTLFSSTQAPTSIPLKNELHQFTSSIDALFSAGSLFPYLMFGGLVLGIGLLVEQKVGTRSES